MLAAVTQQTKLEKLGSVKKRENIKTNITLKLAFTRLSVSLSLARRVSALKQIIRRGGNYLSIKCNSPATNLIKTSQFKTTHHQQYLATKREKRMTLTRLRTPTVKQNCSFLSSIAAVTNISGKSAFQTNQNRNTKKKKQIASTNFRVFKIVLTSTRKSNGHLIAPLNAITEVRAATRKRNRPRRKDDRTSCHCRSNVEKTWNCPVTNPGCSINS